jgi:orotate phosphoribosyltransferase
MSDDPMRLGDTQTDDVRHVARQTVRMFFEVGAIHLNPAKPFIFTSGWASPVYVDCRKLISYPRVRSAITSLAVATVFRNIGHESIDCVVGGETAGIPYAAWVSDRLGVPMLYVRKKPKGFGRNVPIEGSVVAGQRALLVEDLATDGASKIHFTNSLRSAGLDVRHCFVVFYYDIFPGSKKILSDLSLSLHYLATWWDVLAFIKETNIYDSSAIGEIERYLHEPAAWSAEHGGIAEFSAPKPEMAKS